MWSPRNLLHLTFSAIWNKHDKILKKKKTRIDYLKGDVFADEAGVNAKAPYYHYANASLVIPGIQSSRVSDSGTRDRERTGAKEIWEILLVLLPPFNSAILEPNFDLFGLKKEIVVRL